MKSFDVYWHIYRREQIKPEFRGYLNCVLEVPLAPGLPVLRNILDPTGRNSPIAGRETLASLFEGPHHGVVFEGVCKSAVYELVALDPEIREERPQFSSYNREIICNAREFLLTDPEGGLEKLPESHARLLSGDLPLPTQPPVQAS